MKQKANGAGELVSRRQLIAGLTAALTVGPTVVARSAEQSFEITSITLYLPSHEMELRGPPVEALTGYIQSIGRLAKTLVASTPVKAGVSGSLVFALKPPAKSRMWIVLGERSREPQVLRLLKSGLEAIASPAVRGYNAFAINFDGWGGGPRPAPSQFPIPDEWKQAMLTNKGPSILPDDALKVIWPI